MAVMFAPVLFNPAFWAAVGEAALWVGGAAVAVVAADAAIDAISESATETDTRTCSNCEESRNCPSCSPPAGTVELERIDRVPPSRAHHPCPGDHAHTRVMRQNPRTCACFWNKGQVICLPQGGFPPGNLTP